MMRNSPAVCMDVTTSIMSFDLPSPSDTSSLPTAYNLNNARGKRAKPLSIRVGPRAPGAAALTAAERNDLVLEHLSLVRVIATRFRMRLPAHLEFSDLVQAGIVGLLEAARKYQPTHQNAFSTYATHRVQGAILDSLRGQDPASRKLRRCNRHLETVRNDLGQELHRNPTEEEVSERAGIGLDRLRATVLDTHHLTQMGQPENNDEKLSFRQGRNADEEPALLCQQQASTRILKEAIGRLPHSYRTIMTLHYAEELTLKEIGGSFGLPERQISRMHKQALQRMNTMLVAKGITAMSKI